MDVESVKQWLLTADVDSLLDVELVVQHQLQCRVLSQYPVTYTLAFNGWVGPLLKELQLTSGMMLLKGNLGGECKTALKWLLQWSQTACGGLTRLQIQPWFYLLGELLVQFLQERKVPLSPTAFVRQYKSIPGLVEVHFPGYLAAGLLGKIVSGRRQEDDDD